MNRSRIKAHFQYSWWIYLVICAAVVVFWCSVFSHLAAPKADEMLNITIVGDADGEKLSEELQNALEGKTQKPLREIHVEVVSPTNAMLADIVAMRCLGETDLIIFEEDALVTPVSSNFGSIDREQLKEYFPDAVLYEEEGETFGMLLYDGETDCHFSEYYSGDQSCWVFITPCSENAAMLNGKGTKENDTALQAIQYLMEKE